METGEKTWESNYDKFKREALVRFLTYDQEKLIQRLNLTADETYIYMPMLGREYRIHRQEPVMEGRIIGWKKTASGSEFGEWEEADCNAVMTICDLLCHTDAPIQLSGSFTTLEGLNRVKGGSSGVLGKGFYQSMADYFDSHLPQLIQAFEILGGIPEGKGDAAYKVPVFGPIYVMISFYQSDDEFPAQLTFFGDLHVCDYLFYETLWYLNLLILNTLKEIMEDISE